jgi:general secretion pathway protein G
MNSPFPRAGFTLTHLVAVLLILAVLVGALAPRVSEQRAGARDVRRLQDLETVRDAITRFHAELGYWPAPDRNGAFGGWDVSHDGDMIPELVESGYLREAPRDPVDDDTYHYRYYVYEPGSFGCVSDGAFYVLGVKNFETGDFAEKNRGWFRCEERDWGDELAYVTGGGASLK